MRSTDLHPRLTILPMRVLSFPFQAALLFTAPSNRRIRRSRSSSCFSAPAPIQTKPTARSRRWRSFHSADRQRRCEEGGGQPAMHAMDARSHSLSPLLSSGLSLPVYSSHLSPFSSSSSSSSVDRRSLSAGSRRPGSSRRSERLRPDAGRLLHRGGGATGLDSDIAAGTRAGERARCEEEGGDGTARGERQNHRDRRGPIPIPTLSGPNLVHARSSKSLI